MARSQHDTELDMVKEKVLESLKVSSEDTEGYNYIRVLSETAETKAIYEESNQLFALIVVSRDIIFEWDEDMSTEQFSIICKIDKSREKCDSKRVGTLKFEGDLECNNLEEFMATHWLPPYEFNYGKVDYEYNCAVVKRAKLPGIDELHRYRNQESWEGFNWARWRFWGLRGYLPGKKISPPDHSPNKTGRCGAANLHHNRIL